MLQKLKDFQHNFPRYTNLHIYSAIFLDSTQAWTFSHLLKGLNPFSATRRYKRHPNKVTVEVKSEALFTRADSSSTDFSAAVERSIVCMGGSLAEESVRVNTSIEACALLDRDGKIRRGKTARVNRA